MKIFNDFLNENVNSDKFKKTKTIPISGNKDGGVNDLKITFNKIGGIFIEDVTSKDRDTIYISKEQLEIIKNYI